MSDKRTLKNQKHFSLRITVFGSLALFMFGSIYLSRIVSPTSVAKNSVTKSTSQTLTYLIPSPAIEIESEEISTTSAVLGADSDLICLVTINDKKYNLTNYPNLQKEKDIFDCGSDATKKYKLVYGEDLKVVFPYEIDSKGNFLNHE